MGTSLRIAWVVHAETIPVPLMDSYFYDQSARRLADGLGFTSEEGIPTALFPPGYSFALAGIYRLVGAGVVAAQGFNVAVSGGIVLLTYAIGRMTIGRRAAITGALLWAVLPSQILWTSLVMAELLFTLACLASLVLGLAAYRSVSIERRLTLATAAGIVAGAALLIRGQSLALAAAFVVWCLLQRRPRYRPVAFFLVLMAVMVIPWTVRNARQLDAFVPLSTTVGWNAAIGHSDHATGGFWSPISVGLFGEHYFDPYPAREVAFHRAGLRLAWDWARHHPRAELDLSLAKVRILWQRDDDAVAWQELGGAGALSPGQRSYLPGFVNGFYRVLMIFAGVGLAAGLIQRKPWGPLVLLLVLSWTAFHVLFFAANRYHYPLLPILCLAAAAGLAVAGKLVKATLRAVRG